MSNRTTDFLARFSKLGIENNISFSSQEILNDCAIGLDGKHRKLVVLKQCGQFEYDWHIINLDEVLSCFIKKTYRGIKAGELKKRGIDNYLESIILRLEFLDHRTPIEISFYEHAVHKGRKVLELDRKAKNWQIMLSKMIRNQLQMIA
ncbi:hypothetical protein OCK74_08695 [Chitinophagaceae bacterium LB-8]|uniref:Uncharacterized protein n=2 Tax=Paraflavisolibacter caeni TaxID=2982496 RepID=A0A9X2XUB0_9BACT|nr:hypothetical protein [Paraflavisolibacter caeni]